MGAFMKDKRLILFWGIIAGAALVGCILVFGQGMNWINARGSFTVPPLYFKIGLLLVMVAVLFLLAKMWIFFNGKITRKEAEKIFTPELITFIYQAPLAKAIVEHRTDLLDGLRFLPQQTRVQCVNAPVHEGITPLHIAAALGRKNFCAALLKYGAELYAQDSKGETPQDYALRFHQQETFLFLQTYKK